MNDRVINSLKNLLKDAEDSGNSFYKDGVTQILKNAGKKGPKKALYAAAFLTETSRKDLYNWWSMHVKEQTLDRIPKHSHMTIQYERKGLSPEDVLSLPIGETGTVKVIGYASNEMGQAVQVSVSSDSFRRKEGIAHVTISAADDAPMGFAYSNQLLSEGVTEVKAGPELDVKIGLFLPNGEIKYDLSETFYQTSTVDDYIEVDV